MNKLSFEKFNTSKIDVGMLNKISGGDYSTPGDSVTMSNVAGSNNGVQGVWTSCTVSWGSDTAREGVGIISYNNETSACAGFRGNME